jgi:hypothetical protein
VVPSDFHLEGIERKGRGATVKINRGDGSSNVDVSFLSAGENEVLFVFLVSINACLNKQWGNSILLLDEPDLHIANSARLRFFTELLKYTLGSCQLVMCTHSPTVSDALSISKIQKNECMQSVFKVAENFDPTDIKLVSQYDAVFLERMREINFSGNPLKEFFRQIFAKLNREVVFTRAAIQSSGLSVFNASDLAAKVLVFGFTFISIVSFGIMVISTANDKEFPNSPDAFAWHGVVDKLFYPALFGIIVPIACICLIRRSFRKKQSELAKKIASLST